MNGTSALKIAGIAFAFAAVAGSASAGPVVLGPGDTEVVVADGAVDSVRFAGEEMTNFLSRAFGGEVPLVAAPTEGRHSIILGDNEWSKAEGMSTEGFEPDTFVTRAAKGRVYILGQDDRFNLRGIIRSGGYGSLFGFNRATMHGAYDFLERYAGVRFYLPDEELGVIVPKRASIEVPEGEAKTTPSFLIREPYMGGDGSWYCEKNGQDRNRLKTLMWLRLRMSSQMIPCCHGSQRFRYIERFAKTRPDYLALKKDGTRWDDPKVFAAYQYCWSNPDLQDTLYGDVKAYLTGQSAESRGLKGWGVNCRFGRYVDIMPDDSFQGCRCERCQKAYNRDKGPHYATELMWGVAAKIGKRLIDDGVKGDITMMAYPPYRRIPDFELPTNIQVMVAESGPWSMVNPKRLEANNAEIRGWSEKLGHKVWIWTYPHKFGNTAIKGVPCMAPHAWGRYFKLVAPWVFGTFAESESDKSIYNHLNYYVFSRVAWDTSVSVTDIVREYHELMFGRGADDMAKFNRLLETKWLKDVAGRVEDTALGPVAKAPSAYQLWKEIYSKETRDELAGCIRAAVGKVEKGSPEFRRIELMYREFLKPIISEAEAYEERTDVKKALERRAKEPNRSILPPLGARGYWGGNRFDIDTNDSITASGSVHFSGTHTASVRVGLTGSKDYPAMKPNTRYRLSYFVKVRGVQPIKIPGGSSGGVSVNIWDDHNRWFPSSSSNPKGNFFTGTMGWIYQEFEFTSGPLTCNLDPAKGKVNRSYLQLHILYGNGEAWFDDLRLEELGE